MQMKRLYDHDAPPDQWTREVGMCAACQGRGRVVNQAGDGVQDCGACERGQVVRLIPPVRGVEVLHAGPRQRFSQGLVEQGVVQGWMRFSRGVLTIVADPAPVVYRIERMPGHYCCHCGRMLDDEAAGRAHVAIAHAGAPSPDRDNPAGYRRDLFYDCVKEG